MNNIKFLLLGTSLSLIPTLTFAQCVATQDCETLGYTETSCNGGKGVKCPFGNKWACLPTKESICKEEGFTLACNENGQIGSGDACNGLYKQCSCDSSYKYICSGEGYSGGSGIACNGKYAACNCSSGYEWKDGACVASRPVCEIGSLYYGDNTCSGNLESNKTLLGVVIYSNGSSGGGWAMTVNPIATGIAWDSGSNYTTGITDKPVSASCPNTQKLVDLGYRFAAANMANNYTVGARKWCLPANDVLQSINNATNFAKVNRGITIAGGTQLGNLSSGREIVWSSSEANSGKAKGLDVYNSGSFSVGEVLKDYNGGIVSVRPVTEF